MRGWSSSRWDSSPRARAVWRSRRSSAAAGSTFGSSTARSTRSPRTWTACAPGRSTRSGASRSASSRLGSKRSSGSSGASRCDGCTSVCSAYWRWKVSRSIRDYRLSAMRPLPVLAFLALSGVASAQPARVDSAIAKFMAASHAPGVAVAAVVHGNPLWAKGYGMADLENAVPVTAHTLFRLGSVSKPITATEAMVLWERGKLDLDAPIQRYCQSFPEKPWPITTRELLGHLGGIRHYKSGPDDLEGPNTKHFTDGIAG